MLICLLVNLACSIEIYYDSEIDDFYNEDSQASPITSVIEATDESYDEAEVLPGVFYYPFNYTPEIETEYNTEYGDPYNEEFSEYQPTELKIVENFLPGTPQVLIVKVTTVGKLKTQCEISFQR